ncbi:hypothetical protein EZS27_022567, partial [termite gut metagenome]
TADSKQDIVGCRIVAQSGSFSDGEQHLLPVLSNQESITETLALPIRGGEKREFSIESLFNNQSKRSRQQNQADDVAFYVSGLESAYDILQLTRQIKRGEHVQSKNTPLHL